MLNALALKPGEEQFESYYSSTVQKDLIHYNYRSVTGELFSCSSETLEKCRILCKKYAQRQD